MSWADQQLSKSWTATRKHYFPVCDPQYRWWSETMTYRYEERRLHRLLRTSLQRGQPRQAEESLGHNDSNDHTWQKWETVKNGQKLNLESLQAREIKMYYASDTWYSAIIFEATRKMTKIHVIAHWKRNQNGPKSEKALCKYIVLRVWSTEWRRVYKKQIGRGGFEWQNAIRL